jgi:ABC-type sugar transport system ATPase subunit
LLEESLADPADRGVWFDGVGSAPTNGRARYCLEARNLNKHFASVVALSDGNFQLLPNEIHAIVGDNGAGKSTLIKIITGALQPDGGEILLDGRPVMLPDPSAARRLGISTVFQDLALINHLDASANMFLGREILMQGPLAWFGILNKRAMREATEAEIRRLKIGVKSVDQLVAGMSGGQRQAVAVARAITFGTRIVVMDEPTAALGVREGGAVLDMILELKQHGLTVVMISHNMPDVFKVADRITIMRLGRTVATLMRDQSSLQEIVGYMTGAFGAKDQATMAGYMRAQQ